MALDTNQFFDINQLPVEEGVLFFGISMNRISNRQSAEECFKDLQHLDTKINKTKGIGMVMWYGDYLYFHSEEKAHILRDRYKHLMLSHKNAFMRIIENKPEWTIKAFSFMGFGQVMLDNSQIFQSGFQVVYDLYKTDEKFKECVNFDCSRIKVDFDERNVLFILEEITSFYLASKSLLNFNNRFIENTQNWILQGYPGKPLKSEVYLFQKNPLNVRNSKNKFENSYYDLESKILYDYTRLDLETFDFSEKEIINLEQEKSNLENVEVREIEGKGKGLFAKKDFKMGEKVWRLNGEVVNYATDYTIPVGIEMAVEPRLSGSIGQYMNHSCEPNMGPQNGRDYMAMRDIKVGEELFTHYGFLGYEYGHEKTIDGLSSKSFDLTCKCGTKSCKGKLGCYKDLTKEEREKWKDYILPFLQNTEKYK